MTDFIPPYPKRHKTSLGPLDTINYLRRDFLSIWPEKAFERQFMSEKIMNRMIFIANCPQVVSHVLLSNHANYERKTSLLRKMLTPLLGDGLFISDGTVWQQRRDLETPMFSDERLGEYLEVMNQAIEERVQRWSEFATGATIPVLTEMKQLSAEIISRMLFGDRPGAQQAARLAASFDEYQAAIEHLDFNTFFGLPSWLSGIKPSKTAKAAKAIHDIVDKLVAEGEGVDSKNALLAQFLRYQQEAGTKGGITREQVRNELVTLFMAGYETVANTLAWSWYLISQCPDVEQRLHDEIDTVLGKRSATLADVAQLHYTRAIIEETLRLYPPVPLLSREAIADDTIRKRHVPAGSTMLIVPWLLHRHKTYWDKPDHFMPERFLSDAPVKPDSFAYLPFGIGPRACIAKRLGLAETTLCLALLARKFCLRVPEGQVVAHECRLILRPKDNLPMRISALSH